MRDKDFKIGSLAAAAAYIIWGFLPIYWKGVATVAPGVILSHRIIWSFLFMVVLLFLTKKWSSFIQACKVVRRDKMKLIGITLASLVISGNWLIFIGLKREYSFLKN